MIGLGDVEMALTTQQLLGNPRLNVRFPDGREVTYRSVDNLRKAKAEIEEDIRQTSGQTGISLNDGNAAVPRAALADARAFVVPNTTGRHPSV